MTHYDQASGLRTTYGRSTKEVKVIAVTSGKGGVGKTSVSLNMAVALSQKGHRVFVLDADLGLANVDVMLGLRATKNLSDVIAGSCNLDDILLEGPQKIKILPATSGMQSMVNVSSTQQASLIHAFNDLKTPCDVLIVDTAAGISNIVLNFSCASQHILLVVSEDPSSITDAYALMKLLNRQYGISSFKVAVNMARDVPSGIELFMKLRKVADSFLNVALEMVANIPFDESVRKSVRRQRSVVDMLPDAPSTLSYKKLATHVEEWPTPSAPSGYLSFFVESFFRYQNTQQKEGLICE
jgi:flagellar biosynthesis protein FlhG